MINLVNENKAVSGQLYQNSSLLGEQDLTKQQLEDRSQRLQGELQDAREALLQAHGEIEKLKTQFQQVDLNNQRDQFGVDSRKLELERQFLERN